MAVAQLIQARKLKNMECDPSVDIGDLVFLDVLNPNKVLSASDNNTNTPIMGLVLSKPSTTVAKILLNGIVNIGTIIQSGRIYLGVGGGLSLSVPTEDYLQELGVSFGDGIIDFQPNPRRVKRTTL